MSNAWCCQQASIATETTKSGLLVNAIAPALPAPRAKSRHRRRHRPLRSSDGVVCRAPNTLTLAVLNVGSWRLRDIGSEVKRVRSTPISRPRRVPSVGGADQRGLGASRNGARPAVTQNGTCTRTIWRLTSRAATPLPPNLLHRRNPSWTRAILGRERPLASNGALAVGAHTRAV
jgi:hypothetical protein